MQMGQKVRISCNLDCNIPSLNTSSILELFQNLCKLQKEAQYLIIFVGWVIQCRKNRFVFDSSRVYYLSMASKALLDFKEYNFASAFCIHTAPPILQERAVMPSTWSSSPANMIKTNCDASFLHHSSWASSRVICSKSKWVSCGWCRKKIICSFPSYGRSNCYLDGCLWT